RLDRDELREPALPVQSRGPYAGHPTDGDGDEELVATQSSPALERVGPERVAPLLGQLVGSHRFGHGYGNRTRSRAQFTFGLPDDAVRPRLEACATVPHILGSMGESMGAVTRSRAWGVAAVATLAMSVSYVDRQTLAVLAPTVRAALGISREDYGRLLAAFS